MSSPTVRGAPPGASPDAGGRVRRQRDGSGEEPGSATRSGTRARGRSGARAAAARAGAPVTLTGRGGVVVVFAVGLLGALLARWLDMPVLSGAGFAAGCALAALATRPADLLTLVVSPPAVFLAVTVLAEIVTTLGQPSLVRSVAVGVLSALAGTAPWLFGGTALVLVITLPRGLRGNVRELRGRLAGSRLFEQEENENPVRWEEPAASPRERRRQPHGEAD